MIALSTVRSGSVNALPWRLQRSANPTSTLLSDRKQSIASGLCGEAQWHVTGDQQVDGAALQSAEGDMSCRRCVLEVCDVHLDTTGFRAAEQEPIIAVLEPIGASVGGR